jgi:hypothetical protein
MKERAFTCGETVEESRSRSFCRVVTRMTRTLVVPVKTILINSAVGRGRWEKCVLKNK